MKTIKYGFLDSMRGIAIIMVILYHIHFLGISMPGYTQPFIIGVSLFFIISSYTLSLSMANKEPSSNRWRNFYNRRFFRIYPLFFGIITALYICSFKRDIFSSIYQSIPGWINYISHIFFVYGFSPQTMNSFHIGEWSLFNEAFFYIIFPVAFLYMKKGWKNTFILFISSIVIYIIWNLVAFSSMLTPYTDHIFERRLYVYYFPLYHVPDFMMGFILFHLHNRWFNNPLPQKYLIPLSIIHLLLFSYVIYLNTNNINIHHLVRVILFGMFGWLMMQGGGIYRILHNKIFSYIGKISYSLYLLNLPVIFSAAAVIHYYNFNILWGTGITIGILFCIASITYRFELRWIGYGKKFEK